MNPLTNVQGVTLSDGNLKCTWPSDGDGESVAGTLEIPMGIPGKFYWELDTTAGTGGGSAINSGGNGNFSNPGAGGVSGGAGGANSGGGGGAGGHNSTPGIQCGSQGGNGGSGIVIIRYKFQ